MSLEKNIDVTRLAILPNLDYADTHLKLTDGVREHGVKLAGNTQSTQQEAEQCDGPQNMLLRQKCAVGLAQAWRWSEVVGADTPNVTSPEQIRSLLNEANDYDADPGPHAMVTVHIGGYYSLRKSPDKPVFVNYGIKKLAQTVRGTGAELKKNQAIMLDHFALPMSIIEKDMSDVYRIRVAENRRLFAFRSSIKPNINDPREKYDQDVEEVLARAYMPIYLAILRPLTNPTTC